MAIVEREVERLYDGGLAARPDKGVTYGIITYLGLYSLAPNVSSHRCRYLRKPGL
jgi:hypothetical protein